MTLYKNCSNNLDSPLSWKAVCFLYISRVLGVGDMNMCTISDDFDM